LADLSQLHEFLRRSKRRAITAALLDQAVMASCAALAGMILLLFLGTQILNWYWLVILFGGSFGFGLYRTIRRIPSDYGLAQRVDRRLELGDSLSTACYFAGADNGNRQAGLKDVVLRRAEEMCAKIAVETAAPIRFTRSVYVAGVLALAAAGMFGVRFGVRGSLDLRTPLMPGFADYFMTAWQVAGLRKPVMPRNAKLPPPPGAPFDPLAEEALQAFDENGAFDELKKNSMGLPDKKPSTEDTGLLDKLMDAWKDLVKGVNVDDEQGGGAESTANKSEYEKGEKGEKGGKGEKGEKGNQAQNQPGQGAPDPNQPTSDEQANAQSASTPSQGEEDFAETDTDDGSERTGAGQGNGSMEIRNAERLNAMGKINEQYLERQAKITGEMMVEVPSNKKQDLATPYSQSDAAHAEGGGQIHRDQVPLIYQQYVQQYFEQVRKTEK
jgi:hypothetical protein